MTDMKALLTAGLLVTATAVFAAPTVEMMGAGAAAGTDATFTILVHPNGTPLNSATFILEASAVDGVNIDLPTPAVGTAPTGWDTPVMNQIDNAGKKRILFTTAIGTAQSTDPLTFTIKITQKATGFKATRLDLIAYDDQTGDGSNVSDDQYTTIGLPAASAAIVPGKVRNLGGVMNNAVSVAPGLIAAAAGSSLHLLNAADAALAAAAGWETPKPLDGPVSGRPAFGAIDGAQAVAVGTDAGTLSVFSVAGAALGSYKGDFTAIPTAPAIGAGNNVYVAGQTAGGVSIARVAVTGGSAALGEALAVAGAATVQSSPAVADGALVVGTNTSVFYAKVAPGTGVMTPQAVTGLDGVAFNTSPVVAGGAAFVADLTGKVYKLNLATGVVDGSSAAIAGPLSDPFAQAGKVHFGGADGKVYTFNAADVTAAPTTLDVGAGPVVQVVDTGALVVAATQSGTVKAGAASIEIGGGVGKAVALLPGTPASVVINKVNGDVYMLPVE